MARYIDADKIDYTVTMVGMGKNAGCRAVAFESDIDDIPTADVVPKSEYDRLENLFNDMTQEAKGYLNRLYGIRADVAREIFEEIEKYLRVHEQAEDFLENEAWRYGDTKERQLHQYAHHILESLIDYFAELKKKYTEVLK